MRESLSFVMFVAVMMAVDRAQRAPGCLPRSATADVYRYSNAGRLTGAKSGAAATATAGDISLDNVPTAVAYPDAVAGRYTETWELDLEGSRKVRTLEPAGGTATQDLYNTTESVHAPDVMGRYVKINDAEPSYDYAGNLTFDGTFNYWWDYEDRLTAVSRASDSTLIATYRYDAFGRRVERSVLDESVSPAVWNTVRYVYDGPNVVEERDGSGALLASYVFGEGMDDVVAMDRGGNRYFHLGDGHGNVAALTDSAGAVVERYRYDAYGRVEFLTDAGVVKSVASSDYGNPLLFQARNYDPESGLYNFRARYYSPALGRFLSHDPNEYADATNLYQYCLQNPGNLSDPNGEVIETIWDIFSIGVGLVSMAYDIYTIATTGKGWGNLALDVGGLAVDVAAAFVPFVPGGASVGIKASRAAAITTKAITWGRRADVAANIAQSAYYGYEAYQAGDVAGMAWSAVGIGLSGTHAGVRAKQLSLARKAPSARVTQRGLEATRVTKKGLARIERHLTRTPGLELGAPEMKMLERLKAGRRTPQDLRFYQHELAESRFLRKTRRLFSDPADAVREAHHRTLVKQGLYRQGYETELFHPEAMELFER